VIASKLFGAVGCLLLISAQLAAQTGRVQDPATPIAFVNVHVVSMDDDRVHPQQTVVVRGDRIEMLGATGEVVVPTGAAVIDGAGRFLLPGLSDAHVHLEGDGTGLGTQRPDFGDGPLYLAYGVTTVFNLRGTPTQLEWRERIARVSSRDRPSIRRASS
jgi:imidazolonepropionase-like amidohydrolase